MTAFQRGNRLYAEKRYGEALASFLEHAREIPSEAANAYASAAKCCRYADGLEAPKGAAEGYYRAALEADPPHFLSLRGLAELLPDKAPERLALLERAAGLRADLLVLISLGDYHRSVLKDLPRAHETYRRAQEAHPRDPTAYLRLNDVCRRLGRPEEAKEWSARWQRARA